MPNDSENLDLVIPAQSLPSAEAIATSEPSEPNLALSLERIKLDTEQNALEKAQHELHVERTMLEERRIYAEKLFMLSVVWTIFIGAFLVAAGLGNLRVSDSVLIALITTTTANVLGLFYIVAKWLFPQPAAESSVSSRQPVAKQK